MYLARTAHHQRGSKCAEKRYCGPFPIPFPSLQLRLFSFYFLFIPLFSLSKKICHVLSLPWMTEIACNLVLFAASGNSCCCGRAE